jgi:phosphoglycolate phosphatase
MEAALLIFDLDGTLIDSREDIARAVNETLAEYGDPALPVEVIGRYVGTGVWPLVEERLVSGKGLPPEEILAAFQRHYEANILVSTKLYPGALEALKRWKSRPMAVLTNKHDDFVLPILKGLGIADCFQGSYGRHAFEERKPSGLPIRRICEKHGVRPEAAIMVGDTSVDVRAGRAAGAMTCGVLFGYGAEAELAEADFRVSSWAELERALS